MKLHVLSVRDRAADVFGQPMFVPAVGVGVRSFVDELNRQGPDNVLSRHPEDFDLYELGTYDDNTGRFQQLDDGPRQVAVGKDLVRKES